MRACKGVRVEPGFGISLPSLEKKWRSQRPGTNQVASTKVATETAMTPAGAGSKCRALNA